MQRGSVHEAPEAPRPYTSSAPTTCGFILASIFTLAYPVAVMVAAPESMTAGHGNRFSTGPPLQPAGLPCARTARAPFTHICRETAAPCGIGADQTAVLDDTFGAGLNPVTCTPVVPNKTGWLRRVGQYINKAIVAAEVGWRVARRARTQLAPGTTQEGCVQCHTVAAITCFQNDIRIRSTQPSHDSIAVRRGMRGIDDQGGSVVVDPGAKLDRNTNVLRLPPTQLCYSFKRLTQGGNAVLCRCQPCARLRTAHADCHRGGDFRNGNHSNNERSEHG